jgi:hypothetical protein
MRSEGCSLCSGGVREGFHGSMHHAKHQRFSTKQRISAFVKQNIFGTLMGNLFSIAIILLCIYLSWTCNTRQGVEVALKIVYAFFAAFFNVFYLIYYYFVSDCA